MAADTVTFEIDGRVVRDLNGNGQLDPYEDPRLPVEERVDDLLAQMTLEEKAGLMFHPPIGIPPEGELLDEPSMLGGDGTTRLVAERHLNHFNLYFTPDARTTAEWHNRLQRLAEGTRLGIPVTISSDPRHSFDENPATSWASGSFSQWPEPIGLGAIGDEELVRRFGEIARQEYRAVGIHVALHPMADVATEPRWARIFGTFGEDVELVGRLTAAYIRGFQGDELGPTSVACMTKHFPGGGPQADGEDPHFPYGKDQVYPGGRFEEHLRPFESAFAAGTAQIMPYYGRPVGTELEPVGFGYNREVVTDMLRGRFGFDGVVCTDWGLVSDRPMPDGSVWEAKAWGVEELDAAGRVVKIVEAGCDQFGGETLPELLVELVRAGRISESRIDESARRLLRDKFRLGLFDDPYVDPVAAATLCGSAEFRAAGAEAQRRAMVLIANDGLLPLKAGARIYVDGLSAEAAAAYGEVVESAADADAAIVFRNAPFEPRTATFIESVFHAGNLEFPADERVALVELARTVPTVFVVHLERPAILTELAEAGAAVIGSFGASPDAILDVVFGRFAPTGKLPFELPSSMAAADRQLPDVPCDSEAPLFPLGHGLTYGG
ncbi:MAG: glycoside hydrolase family 3 protein [Gaiellaceae bacterium]